MQTRKGVLLLNLGTPKSPETQDVKEYLREFLNDPYVIDIPILLRKILVNGIILNTRPKKSAEAYQKIWTPDGSPLMLHTKNLTHKVQEKLNQSSHPASVKMAMRYGAPSMLDTLREFKKENIQELVFIPLYPQYSYAASESSIALFHQLKKKQLPDVRVKIIEHFFSHPRFIQALADSMREPIARFKPDCLLLSYHGIPERQIAKIAKPPTQCCAPECCDQWNQANFNCYRAQCFETSRLVAKELRLPPEQVVTIFQSRLGRTKWIEPYTDFVLKELPKKGQNRILVASPSFTSDCLETLEEIQIRYDELFKESGGKDFEYIPCLNSRPDFVDFISNLASP